MSGKGRPGGNPDIGDYAFEQKHEWTQPCSAVKTLRMPPLMSQAIKKYLPNWHEVCRRAIARELPEEVAAELGWPFIANESDDESA